MAEQHRPTMLRGRDHAGRACIHCLDCGQTSWNENDVRAVYCARCGAVGVLDSHPLLEMPPAAKELRDLIEHWRRLPDRRVGALVVALLFRVAGQDGMPIAVMIDRVLFHVVGKSYSPGGSGDLSGLDAVVTALERALPRQQG